MYEFFFKQSKRNMALGVMSTLLLSTSISYAQDAPADIDAMLESLTEDSEPMSEEIEGQSAGAEIVVDDETSTEATEIVAEADAPSEMDLSEGQIEDDFASDMNGVGANNYDDADDLYFDSVTGPSDVVQDAAPVKVDPREQPGQSFIVVKKNSEAGSYESRIVAANRALKLGRDAAALSMFEALYKSNPRDPRVLMGLAVAQQRSGFKASAIQTYEELLRRSPNNQEATINMLGLMKDQYPEVALQKLLNLHERNPSSPGIAAQIGAIFGKMGDYKRAMRYLQIASSFEPNNATHAYNLAIVADKMGDKSEAIDMYEQALQIDATYGSSRSIPRQVVYDRLSELRRL